MFGRFWRAFVVVYVVCLNHNIYNDTFNNLVLLCKVVISDDQIGFYIVRVACVMNRKDSLLKGFIVLSVSLSIVFMVLGVLEIFKDKDYVQEDQVDLQKVIKDSKKFKEHEAIKLEQLNDSGIIILHGEPR